MENNKSISIYLTFFQYWLMASLINEPLRQFISLFNLTLESVRNRISFWWDSSWRVSLLSRERFFIFILFLLRGLGGGTGGDPESPSWTFLSSYINISIYIYIYIYFFLFFLYFLNLQYSPCEQYCPQWDMWRHHRWFVEVLYCSFWTGWSSDWKSRCLSYTPEFQEEYRNQWNWILKYWI